MSDPIVEMGEKLARARQVRGLSLDEAAALAFQASGTFLSELGWGTGPDSRP